MKFRHRISNEQFEIIAQFSGDTPVRLGDLATALGLKVSLATLQHGISGQIKPDALAPAGFAIRINRHEAKTRQRFTLAHEIAHFLLHKDKLQNGISETVLYRADGITNTEEVEANQLAASILMPSSEIGKKIAEFEGLEGNDLVASMAEHFRVSQDAMRIRLG